MAIQTLVAGTGQKLVDQVSATQASTDSETTVSGSSVDTALSKSVGYTLENSGANSIDVTVYRANQSSFSDEAQHGSAITIAAGAKATYVDAPAGFRFYRLKVKSSSAGLAGTLVAQGFSR